MRTLAYALVAVLVVAAGGCGRKKNVQLPPAQGPGAAPLPELPAIPKDEPAPGGGGQSGSGSEATQVAPTEGRTTGTTYPRAEAQIGPKGQGLISRVMVKEGDRVRRGMVLFQQDTRDAELRVEQAKAALEAARVNFKATETDWGRTKQMTDKGAVSAMQADQVQARWDAARVGVQQAEVALRIAEKALADGTIRSPIDGVVTAKLKSEGEMVMMMPPTVVLVVQDQSVLELRFRLPEKSLREVKKGDVVGANFEALGTTRSAKVTRINSALDARTRTVEVVADIPNRDGVLKSGLLAEVVLHPQAAPAPAPGAATTPPAPSRQAGRGPGASR